MRVSCARASSCARSASSATSASTSAWSLRSALSCPSRRCTPSTRFPRGSRAGTMRSPLSTGSRVRWPVRSRASCRCRWALLRAPGSQSAPQRRTSPMRRWSGAPTIYPRSTLASSWRICRVQVRASACGFEWLVSPQSVRFTQLRARASSPRGARSRASECDSHSRARMSRPASHGGARSPTGVSSPAGTGAGARRGRSFAGLAFARCTAAPRAGSVQGACASRS